MSLALGKHPARLLGLVAAALAWPAVAQNVDAMLRDADRYRTGADNLQVDTLVQSYKTDGSLDKERRYTVFAQQDRRTLVLMQSAAEKGQKVLMLGDDFWLLMPSSQRPMRITPMQKLLGDASTGDIATMRWSGDYTATLVGEEPCQPDEARACYRLALQAARKGVTYQRVELWLARQRHEPVRAQLYVQSDKLAKTAHFELDASRGQVDAMVLIDQLGQQRQTRIRYLQRKERTVPEEWLNPMFLARSPVLE
ncbi:MAG: outer membrane lipoprotein-sorting protein [Comamonadaceae bacterium SCN 68-20]|nr:MAG: outer membrane lipoprotein-sorting protein [Comamonadaceae bacterium SCN 68-20]OJX31275.1 MAG: outer membrane lipoprotein-sorting protein [Burkholderiales bacterium 68-20]